MALQPAAVQALCVGLDVLHELRRNGSVPGWMGALSSLVGWNVPCPWQGGWTRGSLQSLQPKPFCGSVTHVNTGHCVHGEGLGE